QRAERDKKARQEMIFKLKRKLASKDVKSLVGNSGYRRYLKIAKGSISLDREAIRREARYDGKYLLKTNTDLSPEEVALAYRELWRVERAFRELKSGLELRPIFHWTDSRVRGHIMVCFLALVLESALLRYLREKQAKVGYLQLLADLAALHAVEFKFNERVYLFRTELQGEAYEAFRVLGIRPPQKVQILT
ncbi:IS1634 family transposase, partial [Desulfovirgula thermocuniculi]|uniref:IS1634 family transposase n=1 Tax=Desulfovirgula thermocuniculi TaxID=348842 RepID=UPI00048478B2